MNLSCETALNTKGSDLEVFRGIINRFQSISLPVSTEMMRATDTQNKNARQSKIVRSNSSRTPFAENFSLADCVETVRFGMNYLTVWMNFPGYRIDSQRK